MGLAPKLRATALDLRVIAPPPTRPAMGVAPQMPWAAGSEGDASPPASAPEVPLAPLARHCPPSRSVTAEALLAAWETQQGVGEAVEALRLVLARQGRAASSTVPRHSRPDTKQAQVLALLGRTEGATLAQVIELTGWAPHTARGFLGG